MGSSIFPLHYAGAIWCPWFMAQYGSSWRLMDRPNERSSHTQPIPRGGGIGTLLPIPDIASFHRKDSLPIIPIGPNG